MGELRTSDLNAAQVRTAVAGDWVESALDFSGNRSQPELENAVMQLVTNIACLKDHLNAWCKARNLAPPGEALINSNHDVAIIHDLWNIDKHFQLSKPPRSGCYPKLQDIGGSAVLTTLGHAGSEVAMSFNPDTGQVEVHGDGKIEFVVDADVVDTNGTRIGMLSEVAARAVAAWETAFTACGVPLPSHP